MLRDMEELLNLVSDLEIKDYIKEALNCYNSGSYKACVVMSVIAGIYDLHKKVKELANSSEACKELDDEIDAKKNKLEAYERYLIQQCGTKEIDMLNPNEVKELIRCLDTRNDCAHPSNFICSAEKARDVYSSIIDLICSKPVLFGCKNLNKIIIELKEKTFFPVIENEKVKRVVQESINKFHSRAIEPLLNKVSKTITTTEDYNQRQNAIYFLAISEKCISDYSENYLKDFLKEENEKYLLQLLGINPELLNYFSDTNIDRIIKKFEINLESKKINNLDNWISVLLSKKINNGKIINSIISKMFSNENNNISIVIDILRRILYNDICNIELKNFILNEIKNNYNLLFDEETVYDDNLLEIIKLIDNSEVYEKWLTTIVDYFNSFSDFYIMNSLVDSSFRKLPTELWIDKVSENLKIDFVKCIVEEANLTKKYCSSSARDLLENFNDEYPQLIGTFLDYLENNPDSEYYHPTYCKTIVSFINDDKKIEEFKEKVKVKSKEIQAKNSEELDFE